MARLAELMVVALLLVAPEGHAPGSSDIAALQIALHAKRVYAGTVDGVPREATTEAVIAFQRRAGLEPDGIAGPLTRRALGVRGRPKLGTRKLELDAVGWDVAELQFLLAWHGFPSGRLDGVFGERLLGAVRRFQRWAGLRAVGVVGPRTLAALSAPIPRALRRLAWPLRAELGDGFGPRGAAFHAGIDLKASAGAQVGAAAPGWIAYAAPAPGWGNLVVVAHGGGVRTFYAHLSRVDVELGQRVKTATRLGLVGETGHSFGPHLHFEVRVRGAAVDPISALELARACQLPRACQTEVWHAVKGLTRGLGGLG